MQLPKYSKNSIFYGDENRGIEITENEMYIHGNGERRLVAPAYGGVVAKACGCEDENSADGFFHLNEIEVSVCQKCGGLIVRRLENVKG